MIEQASVDASSPRASEMEPLILNGRFLTQPLTGVQRFAREVVRELSDLIDLEIVVPRGPLVNPGDLGHVPIRPIGRLAGHLWEQGDLPRYLRGRGSPLLLGLTSTGPMRYPNQIVTHHDIAYARYPESFSRRFRGVYRLVVPRMLDISRRILTVSEFSRGEISSYYGIDPAKITVVHNAASVVFGEDQSNPGARADESGAPPYLLAVAAPTRLKNYGRLVEAFLDARTSTIRELIVVGVSAAPFRPLPKARDRRVRHVGQVDDVSLARLYRGAVAFVFPSLYEGFGIPPLEAQRSGVPVIAARAGALPETLGDSALYVDPYDVAEMRAAIERVDADEGLRRDLSARGRRNAARYSWRRSAELVLEQVNACRALSRGPAPSTRAGERSGESAFSSRGGRRRG